jgi:signal transduction histidine kinase
MPAADDSAVAQGFAGWLQRHGLLLRLAGFYLLISLPTLLIVEAIVLTMEFREFSRSADQGSLLRSLDAEVMRLQDLRAHGLKSSGQVLARELDSWILGMERPRPGGESQTYVVLELSDQPFAAIVQGLDGRILAHNRNAEHWRIDAAVADEMTGAIERAREIARASSPQWMRRYAAPLRTPSGALDGWLVLEVRLPQPWRKLLFKVSYEWPLLIAYLLVFSIGTFLFFNRWVSGRLNRIAAAADAWRHGDFTVSIADKAADELGLLSHRLDRMANDLRELVHARAEVAMLNERARLARDLHDTVKQKAFALSLQIATARARMPAQAGDALPALEESSKLAEEIQRELLVILDELREEEMSVRFREELNIRILAWSRRSNVAVEAILEAAERVALSQRASLVRLLDEALANVLRHSGATQARVLLEARADRIFLDIADNGRGLPQGRREGMGLGNMRSRAAEFPDGQFSVDGRDGVRIVVSWREAGGD